MDENMNKFKNDIEVLRDRDLFDKKTQDIRKHLLLISSICIVLANNNLTLKSFLGLTFEKSQNITIFSGALTLVVIYEYVNFIWNAYSNFRDIKSEKTTLIADFKIKILGMGHRNMESLISMMKQEISISESLECTARLENYFSNMKASAEYALKQVEFVKSFEGTSNTFKNVMTIFVELMIPIALGILATFTNYHNIIYFLKGIF